MSVANLQWGLCIALVLPLVGVAQAKAETIQVIVERLVFSPSDIRAKVGDTIVWINKDPIIHAATVRGGWEIMIPANKTVTQHLVKAEAVDFYCRFHPNMKGRLTIEAE